MKLIVVSICKNEDKTIKELIDRIPKRIPKITTIETIVIDDGSTDSTAAIAKKTGALVYSDGNSKGLAFRFREAVDIALERQADVMVNIDGDLQFNPEDIPKFIKPVADGQYDFVAADRFTDPKTGESRKPENMPTGKYWGNKLGARVVSQLSRQSFRDVTCGFRAYNYKALIALNINGKSTYTQESFQVLAAKRLRILALPTHVTYFKDRKSRVVTSISKYVLNSGLNILRAYRDFAPLRFFIGLGLVPFVLGLLCLIFLGVHWLATGQFSPYKFVGFSGLYLVTLGLFLWSLGVVADMQVRVLNNQEKTQEEIRRLRYDKTSKQ